MVQEDDVPRRPCRVSPRPSGPGRNPASTIVPVDSMLMLGGARRAPGSVPRQALGHQSRRGAVSGMMSGRPCGTNVNVPSTIRSTPSTTASRSA